MKVPAYVCWQLWFLTCTVARAANTTPVIPQDVMDIIRNMHVQQNICGVNLPIVLSILCEKHNDLSVRLRSGRVKRQLANECCYQSCSFFYIMRHYCEKSTVSLEDIPHPSSAPYYGDEINEWGKKNTIHVERDGVTSAEEAGQVRQNITRRPRGKVHWGKRKCRCKKRRRVKGKQAENKIRKLVLESDTDNRPPARLGVILSTRPPIIYINPYRLTPVASNAIYRGIQTV